MMGHRPATSPVMNGCRSEGTSRRCERRPARSGHPACAWPRNSVSALRLTNRLATRAGRAGLSRALAIGDAMRRLILTAILLAIVTPAAAQPTDRLYLMDCGHNSAKDQARWSPGVNVGKPIELSDTCVLIKHR